MRAASPPFVFNVAGPELLNMRRVVEGFAKRLNKEPKIKGRESSDALIGDSSLSQKLFGKPNVGVDQLMNWIASWVRAGRESLNKPTHFETRDGKY